MTRLSHTAKEVYELCGYKYYLHYIEGYRTTINKSPLCFGNAIDEALNTLLKGEPNYKEVFDTEWDKYKDTEIDYFKSDLDINLLTEDQRKLPEPQQYFLSLKAKGEKLLDAYHTNIYPKIKKVISIQDEIKIVGHDDEGNPTEDSITGKIDLIAMIEADDGKIYLTLADNKTTSSPYPKNAVADKNQLALYAVAKPEIEKFAYLTVNKKTFNTQILIDTIPESKQNEVLDQFVTVLDKIKNGVFDKNEKSCYAFGKRCEFYSLCKHNRMTNLIKKNKE